MRHSLFLQQPSVSVPWARTDTLPHILWLTHRRTTPTPPETHHTHHTLVQPLSLRSCSRVSPPTHFRCWQRRWKQAGPPRCSCVRCVSAPHADSCCGSRSVSLGWSSSRDLSAGSSSLCGGDSSRAWSAAAEAASGSNCPPNANSSTAAIPPTGRHSGHPLAAGGSGCYQLQLSSPLRQHGAV